MPGVRTGRGRAERADRPPPQPGRHASAQHAGRLDLAAGNRAEEEDLAGTAAAADDPRRVPNRRRRFTLAGLALTAVLSGVTLVATLVNWAPDGPPPRDLTPAERERLATMRVANYRELRAGLHVTAGAAPPAPTCSAGSTGPGGWPTSTWGPGAGASRGLAQATPPCW